MKSFIYYLFFLTITPLLSFSQDNLVNYVSHSVYGDYFNNETYVFDSPVESASSVDMFRGKISITIPIYTINCNGFKFPVNLRYSSNGFKVNQHASWVGLGWDLTVPGVITRTVQGIPDESDYGGFLGHGGDDLFKLFLEGGLEEDIYDHHFVDPEYWGVYSTPDGANDGAHVYGVDSEENDDAYLDLRHIAENYFDGMPDIFSYHTGRQSGKFVFDRDMNAQEIPKSNNLIFFQIPPTNESGDWSNTSFTVVDEEGIKYIYDVLDIKQPLHKWSILPQREYYTNYTSSRSSWLHYNDLEDNYVSAWHLSKIILPSNQEITFTYECDNLSYFSSINESYFNSSRLYDGVVSDPCEPDDYVKVNRSYIIMNESKHRLTKINWNANEIKFNKSTERRTDMNDTPDKNGYMLDNIAIINNENTFVKKLKFNYSYFEMPHSGWGDASWKRLKLESLTEINSEGFALPSYDFKYYEKGVNGSNYYLPSYFSHHRDLWGYYKRLPINLRISKPKYYIYPDDAGNPMFNSIYSIYPRTTYQGNYYVSSGYDMTPDLSGTRTHVLKNISYPTGGSETIEYELNTFRYDGEDVKGPGVRVKKIVKNIPIGDQSLNSIITEYSYSNADTSTGMITELPLICRFDEGSYKNTPGCHASPIEEKLKWSTCVFSEVRNQKDTEVGYTKITKKSINSQNPDENFKSVYCFDFSGNSFNYEDVFHTELDDYIYKKASSLIWLEDQISGYWPLDQEWGYLQGHIIRDKNPNLLNTDFDWYRGSLLKEEHYNDEDQLLKKIEYNYELGAEVDQVFGIIAYDYYLFSLPIDAELGYVTLSSGEIVYIYSPGLEYRKIRWGAQCYPSVFKFLESKTITSYSGGNQLTDQFFYIYADNEYLNKNKIKKEQHVLSNGDIKQSVYKYPFEYTEESCLITYEDYRESAKWSYFTTLEDECFTAQKCFDFDHGGSEECLECISNAYSDYINLLNLLYNEYETCCNNFVSDDPYASALLQLYAKNQLERIELQEQIVKNSNTLQTFGHLTLYSEEQNGIIKPAKGLTADLLAPQEPINTRINSQNAFIYTGYSTRSNYDKYDIRGNLVQEHKEDDINITYLYGYNYAYPVAKIENSSYQNVIANLIPSYEQLQDKSSPELMTIFDNLRDNMPNSFITSFTYFPLIGIESITDPSGKTTYYSYDNFNRIKTIKNDDKDIVKHFEYHYFED